jgi:hypothetical protein
VLLALSILVAACGRAAPTPGVPAAPTAVATGIQVPATPVFPPPLVSPSPPLIANASTGQFIARETVTGYLHNGRAVVRDGWAYAGTDGTLLTEREIGPGQPSEGLAFDGVYPRPKNPWQPRRALERSTAWTTINSICY